LSVYYVKSPQKICRQIRMVSSSEAITAATVAVCSLLLIIRAQRRARRSTPPAEPTASEGWEKLTCRMPAPMAVGEKAAIRSRTTLEDRKEFFALSCCPITPAVEQRMEQVSAAVSRENYNDHWEAGLYECARCARTLYSADGKFVGPCMWPSFRKPAEPTSLHTICVPRGSYNKYTCDVHEVYCGGCHLFLGHQFADGRQSGDTHPDASDRHCVLSLSLRFRGQ
jgi:peptide-methionine (R)-S-oxide reductase